MRALAHPARLAILEHLSTEGASVTATECAQVAGLSPSATSYHLRALARAGLLEEAPNRGDGRERVWRSAVSGLLLNVESNPGEDSSAARQALLEALLARDVSRTREWIGRLPVEPPEWYQAASFVDHGLLLTAAELEGLTSAVQALLEPYQGRRRTDAPPDARRVSLLLKAIPVD
ncbi:ArsR/SmtB family transcription factor [Plantactinospora siamensis]|uniref:ArsR/SmtB family transcription factor n=1 Tax=Plantactinospora siamensis TaxID=555372 RepID=A0ABV6NP73_9ACTN